MARGDDGRRPWHGSSIEAVVAQLATDAEKGLTAPDVAKRLARQGPNVFAKSRGEPWWEEAFEALTEPLVLLLIAVAVLYAIFGKIEDALTIAVVIVAVAGVEVANEARAKRAIRSLRALSAPRATVVRDGQPLEVPSAEVVAGDVVLLQSGDRVPADLRLIETVALRVDESTLTGESVPVMKQADVVLPADVELGDRRNLAFAGTIVTAGRGRGIVVATGRETEVGRLAGLTEAAREPRTPLQLHLRQLSQWLLWLALGFSVLVPLLGVVIARQPFTEMLLTGLTLAFATIPEELPILVTIVLGLGAYHLARQKAIVKRLRAAETLGSVAVIGTDKTGTLTENRLRVVEVWTAGVTADDPLPRPATATRRLLEAGVLANDARVSQVNGRESFIGDPMEVALLQAAEEGGISVSGVRGAARVLDAYPFDDTRRRMAAVVERDGERWTIVKGAPEAVLAVCTTVSHAGRVVPLDAEGQSQLQGVVDAMAARGWRVLAFAERQTGREDPPELQSVEADLTFLGLAGLEDPPRPEVPSAIADLQAAGVRVLMLTGDHPRTARAIAERVGIDASRIVLGRDLDGASDDELDRLAREVAVFARIAPEQKLRIVRALQARGEIVAVTGDGVNDAPALREAAIGIAMGQVGTDVARDAADLVLADDNFATIATAVRAGRTLYANLRKAVRYYLAAKVALVTASLVAVLAQLPVPFAPVQIIVLELFMDLGASATFTSEPPEGDLLALPPRDPRQPFMDRSMQRGIFAGGLSLAIAVLVAYLWTWAHGGSAAAAQTAAFASWLVGHIVLAAHMRSERQPLARVGFLANRSFLVWAMAAAALLVLGASWPFAQARLHLSPLSATTWIVVVASGLVFPSWWELLKRTAWGSSHAKGSRTSQSSRAGDKG